MKQFSANGQKWLKSFHLLFACLWAGGAVAVNVINFFILALKPWKKRKVA